MITGKIESKILTKDIWWYDANVIVNLVEENIIQVKSGKTMNVDVNMKTIIYVKNTIFGILIHVVVKIESFYQVLSMIHWLHVMKL